MGLRSSSQARSGRSNNRDNQSPVTESAPYLQSLRVILCARPEEIREHDSEPSRPPGGDDADGDVDHGEIGIGRDFHDLLKA